MAAIEKTAFELRVSNHMFDTTKNITGKFQEGSPTAADAVCAAGFLVVPGDKLPNEGYSGIYNENAYIMGAAATATDALIYACNTFNVQELAGPFGTVYKVGSNILGLAVPAGERGTYTRIDEGDIIRFGEGNFTTAISTNGYATLGTSTNAGKLVPAASAPTDLGALYFTIEGSGKFTQGAYAGFGYVDVKAHRVHVYTAPGG
jgi:hypothetical protein